jgi:hypothetical protein
MARQIEAYKLRTELAVDATKGESSIKAFKKEIDGLTDTFKKLGQTIDQTKGKEAGSKFGKNFASSATAVITSSFDSLGETIGQVIGTALAPGIGTVVGGLAGSAVDKLSSKFTAALGPMIKEGIEFNKLLEDTSLEFKTFTGNSQEAAKYLDELKKIAVSTGTDPRFLIEVSEQLYDLTGNAKLSRIALKAAVDQAADFGGNIETIGKVAEALGLIAEKGELASRELNKLYKLGIDAKKLLSEATGLSEKRIGQLIAQGRIRGPAAVQAIAEGIERQKGGFAALRAGQTVSGAERRFGVQKLYAEQAGTVETTQLIGDAYRKGSQVLESELGQKLPEMINRVSGSIIKATEQTLTKGGLMISQGIAGGMTGDDALGLMGQAVDVLGHFIENQFTDFFGIKSPSKRMIAEVGIPIGQGIFDGMIEGFNDRMQKGNVGSQVSDEIKKFFEKYADEAIKTMQATGVPASITLAQAALESGYGRRAPGFNFFGIKGRGPGGTQMLRTHEQTASGQSYGITAPFAVYQSAEQAFAAHAQFLQGRRYRGLASLAGDPYAYAQGLQRAHYATDTKYAAKLSGLISNYNLGQYDQPGAVAAASTTGAPVPVAVVRWITPASDIEGGARAIFGQAGPIGRPQRGRGGPRRGGVATDPEVAEDQIGKVIELEGERVIQYGEEQAAIVNVNASTQDLIKTNYDQMKVTTTLAQVGGVTTRALIPLVGAENAHATTAIALTKQYQKAMRDQLIMGADVISQISGALGQVAGQVPSQQVGKKRGLFSKILGVAAPFLSLIPGVGPIIGTIASMASSAVGGDYAGALSGLAGGLASGGVFRRSGGGGALPIGKASIGSILATIPTIPPRQFGGPVYAGQRYIVGEAGWETFTPATNGYISPHGNGGGEDTGAMLSAVQELRAAVQHLHAMPAEHVVMRGARGLIRAMDRDAGLIRLTGQRMRLA